MNKFFRKMIKYFICRKYLSMSLIISLLLIGVYCFHHLDIEAYPDFSNPLVHVVTPMPGKGAEDVERLVTIPLEKELNGIPHLNKLYSTTIFGLSVIHVVFDDVWGITSPLIRQQVLERIYQADIPNTVKPQLGPDTAPIGEIYRYTVKSDYYNQMTLKAVEDWQLEKLFKQVPGIAGVTSFGGPIKTYRVKLDHEKLRFYNLDVREVYDAIAASNSTGGGHYIGVNNQAFIVRGIGLFTDAKSIAETVISSYNGIPVRVKDVATVLIEPAVRMGQVGINHQDDAIEGIVLMRKGENPSHTLEALKEHLPKIRASIPNGVYIQPIYERQHLIEQSTIIPKSIAPKLNKLAERSNKLKNKNAAQIASGITNEAIKVMR